MLSHQFLSGSPREFDTHIRGKAEGEAEKDLALSQGLYKAILNWRKQGSDCHLRTLKLCPCPHLGFRHEILISDIFLVSVGPNLFQIESFFFSQKTKKNAFSRILSTIFGSVISVKKNQEHDGTNCTDVKMVWTPPRMLCLHPICVPFQPVIAMTSFTAQLLSASTRVERLIEEVTDIFRLEKAPFPFSNSVITRFRMRTNDRSMGGINMRFRDR